MTLHNQSKEEILDSEYQGNNESEDNLSTTLSYSLKQLKWNTEKDGKF